MTTDDNPQPVPEWLRAAVPEYYIDGFKFHGNPYTVFLSFSLGVPGGESQELTRLRMSPEHAKVMSILFRRAVKLYEKELKIEIAIPPALIQAHDIKLDEDW